MPRYAAGVTLTLISAVAFGTMAVSARNAHLPVETLMLLRFSLASAALWLLVALTRTRIPSGRTLAGLVGMGAGLYFAQSFCYFNALERIPASLTALLLYLYPALVAVASVVVYRRPLSLVKTVCLVVATIGVALTIGPVSGRDPAGIAFGVAAAIFYTAYIMVGDRLLRDVPALAATTVVMTSAAVVYAVMVLAKGQTLPPMGETWMWAGFLALATVIAIGTFLAGIERVGPVDASTYSALEPAVTALMAYLFLRESLAPVQLAGAALALTAVVVLARSGGAEGQGDRAQAASRARSRID